MSNLPSGLPKKAKPAHVLRLAVAGSVVVMIAAGGLFYYASQAAMHKRQASSSAEVIVTIHPHNCEPNALSVPAGRTTFRIVNRSERAVEWEILDGVMVLEERENIAPGLSAVINANLKPGDYTITCGLLSNPHGTMKVIPTAASDAFAKAKPTLVAFLGPLSEYRVYLSLQSSALLKAITALQAAVDAGDLSQAQAAYLPARAAYQHIAPATQRFSEVDNAVNARADYYEKREQDPDFGGFHRIEYSLFDQHTVEGLSPVVQKLQADVTRLKQQMLAQSMQPEQLVGGVIHTLRSLADLRSNGEEERYSHSDLNGFAANLDGARKVIELMRPLLVMSHLDLLQRIDSATAALDEQLKEFSIDGVFRPYDQVSADQRQQVSAKAQTLADALAGIDPALGLSDL
ncbi:iron uptake system protein EfeO [Pseudomonas sp. 10B1]|uniref:iron uptake system protein EfeO n=1 Tax=unclassified Pseudomonas TaxID=196821 RepID=UPI002B228FBA|nr:MULTISPECIES: iron uptake system protein EfeO [unclassified Pseudomonas]MEA9995683.1 iron uptake system protein EfeO [Pseudomonas sp. AA4]MEB0087990.1 iron uptake system protein EfeO [Pseudomonas sp. RTI1]MEB0126984.1 iron uptake system protein EfeO [Pseudomonas sp. CCC1.2]MEB0153822.1 iron uptake system protein EfeO [Pseudomonas sp. CCC4.3]MEB0219075.1 iron uptake system protein EfeO [Pseudomonas sp. AB12(2023)]